MKTRSQTTNKIKQFEVNIDFDDAIKEWRSNKKSTNGSNSTKAPTSGGRKKTKKPKKIIKKTKKIRKTKKPKKIIKKTKK